MNKWRQRCLIAKSAPSTSDLRQAKGREKSGGTLARWQKPVNSNPTVSRSRSQSSQLPIELLALGTIKAPSTIWLTVRLPSLFGNQVRFCWVKLMDKVMSCNLKNASISHLWIAIVTLCYCLPFGPVGPLTAWGQSQNQSQAKAPAANVDWQAMLAQFDMVWGQFPTSWDKGPFLGNGEQGTLLYRTGKRELRWDVGCSAAHDHRPFEKDDLSEKGVAVLNRGRHFIGHLKLKAPADLTGFQSRLSLWNAEATGTIASEKGSVVWRTLAHATEPVMYFELDCSGDLEGASLLYVPEKARSPRAVRNKLPRTPVNPDAVLNEKDGIQTAVQQLASGGQTAVAWVSSKQKNTTRLWLSVQHSFPGDEALSAAVEAVKSASQNNSQSDLDSWIETHRDWWHDYYPASYLLTGDPYWDTFYWIQQYKLACVTRDKGWIIDNQGPWLQPTAWNATWWNLNVQVSHSGVYQANRRGMGSALSHRLWLNRDNLALNVAEPYREDSYAIGRTVSGWDLLGHAGQPGGRPPIDKKIGRECGNLLWGLHNVDLEYRYWQDTELRDRVLYPFLIKAVNYYRHFLVEEEDGLYHLPETFSPEYRRARDCTYDIDLLSWAVARLLELAEEKQISADEEPLIKVWKELKTKLVPAHVNATGRMIGRNVALTGGHRHWSHLIAVYPLRTLTPEADADRQLIEKSLSHWRSFGRGIAGYAHTSASCMASMLGDGDKALAYLNGLKPYLKPNTFYSEINLPVMETPLHGATAMQEMVLQSWGGRLRVFPAVPEKWPNVQFADMRGEGGFLVSGKYRQWVLVVSQYGGEVEVEPNLGEATWKTAGDEKVSKVSSGVYRIQTQPGGWVLFWPSKETQPEAMVAPVSRQTKPVRLGMPKGYSTKSDPSGK